MLLWTLIRAVVAVVAVLPLGCTATDPATHPAPGRGDLRLRDLPPSNALGEAVEDIPKLVPGGRARLEAQTIYFSIDRPVDEIWGLVDTAAFPALTSGVWRMNGIRVGLLPVGRLGDFDEALGAYETGSAVAIGRRHPLPLRVVERFEPGTFVDLTIPPYSRRVDVLRGGRLQLLAAAEPAESGAVVRVTLKPHHFVPRATLTPRDPLEKSLDGRVYDELALRIPLPADQLLVIGLDWPEAPQTPEPVEEADGEADDADAPPEAADVFGDDRAIQFSPATIPKHFGRGLLLQRRVGGWMQLLIVLKATPL